MFFLRRVVYSKRRKIIGSLGYDLLKKYQEVNMASGKLSISETKEVLRLEWHLTATPTNKKL